MVPPPLSRPTREDEVADAIADAARDGTRLNIVGGGSKALIGAPTPARSLDMTGFRGVIDYDPAELVLTVRPGTPLCEVETLVAGENQMLAFEPFDHGPIYGAPPGRATIGGVVASAVSGSQRISCGATRDHLLGFRAVSGRGEAFTAGAKVVKNVTGYDLPKLAAGSWGRLFAITELTLKVLPRPREAMTLAIEGLNPEDAVSAMAVVMGSQAEVAAAAYLPARLHQGQSLMALRIQGVGPSVTARSAKISALLGSYGQVRALSRDDGKVFWGDMAALGPMPGDRPLWRVSVPPSGGPKVAAAAERFGAEWIFDWAGGLVWIAGIIDAATIRETATRAGGHAMLVRAPASQRASVPAMHPQGPGVTALETRIRRAFDPQSVFETGRF